MSKAEFLKRHQREGERYAGLILSADSDYHLFLAAVGGVRLNWDEAMDWAKSLGADSPGRHEQSLLIANLKEEFENYCYWSNEQHADYSDCAWMQHFTKGNQLSTLKSGEYRTIAVRRVYI